MARYPRISIPVPNPNLSYWDGSADRLVEVLPPAGDFGVSIPAPGSYYIIRTELLAGRGCIAPTRLGLNRVPGNPPRSYPMRSNSVGCSSSMFTADLDRVPNQILLAVQVPCSFTLIPCLLPDSEASISSAGSYYALSSEIIERQVKIFEKFLMHKSIENHVFWAQSVPNCLLFKFAPSNI